MSCRLRATSILATLAATVLGGVLLASPAQAAQAAPAAPAAVVLGGDDFVWPAPPHPELPGFPCVPSLPGLPCIPQIPDDFVWPTSPMK
ncbi:hypothetical protein [Streptomyces vietnamensis]|uniref:Secreted protein n=1 Tax=Streptomyces vietnamensis TaxID=362257 RepID=A0A0B5IGA0_9ACTN|nr:hypothetical protein [Streptomyces vietnamensis]AJF67379.1 hypothetical protein SVTN_26375 [Streptomyces vietnamensis]